MKTAEDVQIEQQTPKICNRTKMQKPLSQGGELMVGSLKTNPTCKILVFLGYPKLQ